MSSLRCSQCDRTTDVLYPRKKKRAKDLCRVCWLADHNLNEAGLVPVIVVDQWTSTGNVSEFTMKTFKLAMVSGGDAKAARNIFGGYASKVPTHVAPDARPSVGSAYLTTDPSTGRLTVWKANYDSSD